MRSKIAFVLISSFLCMGCALQMVPTTVCEPGLHGKMSKSILMVEVPESNALKELKISLEHHIISSFEAKGCLLHSYSPGGVKLNSNDLKELVDKTNANQILSVTITNATFNGSSLNYIKATAVLYDLSKKSEIWKTEMYGTDMTLFEHEKHFSETITQTMIDELAKNNLL